MTIGIEQINNNIFLSIKATGKLTHEDYNRLVPLIDSAIEQINNPQINVLFDATEFQGWELRAVWDDFKLGVYHGTKFKKVALVSSHQWQEVLAKIANWFVSGEVKTFKDTNDAIEWIHF